MHVSICVCVCVCASERVCVCVCACMHVCVSTQISSDFVTWLHVFGCDHEHDSLSNNTVCLIQPSLLGHFWFDILHNDTV